MSHNNPYTEDFTQASEYLRLVLTFLSKHKIPASPLNYQMGYEYVSGRNAGLEAALNDLLVHTPQPSAQSLFKLYQQFVVQDDSALESVREELQKVIGSIQQGYTKSNAGLSDYIGSLNRFAEMLTDPAQPGMAAEVEKVMADTRSTESSQRNMESQMGEMLNEVEDLRKQLKQVREESLTDALTGIANRKAFDLALEEVFEQSQEQGAPFSLVISDIDHFKKFNDNFGHLVGDKVLRYVATTIKSCVKGKDTAARFGGEEFVMILPQTKLEDARVVADQIRQAVSVRELKDKRANKDYGRITISLGVAQFQPGEQAMEILNRADAALYQAKENGRNRVEIAA